MSFCPLLNLVAVRKLEWKTPKSTAPRFCCQRDKNTHFNTAQDVFQDRHPRRLHCRGICRLRFLGMGGLQEGVFRFTSGPSGVYFESEVALCSPQLACFTPRLHKVARDGLMVLFHLTPSFQCMPQTYARSYANAEEEAYRL